MLLDLGVRQQWAHALREARRLVAALLHRADRLRDGQVAKAQPQLQVGGAKPTRRILDVCQHVVVERNLWRVAQVWVGHGRPEGRGLGTTKGPYGHDVVDGPHLCGHRWHEAPSQPCAPARSSDATHLRHRRPLQAPAGHVQLVVPQQEAVAGIKRVPLRGAAGRGRAGREGQGSGSRHVGHSTTAWPQVLSCHPGRRQAVRKRLAYWVILAASGSCLTLQ